MSDPIKDPSLPPPTAQHHAAPTCDGWWWARYHGWHPDPVRGTWVAVKVTNLNSPGWRTRYDRYVGPLLPPDTTEPAPVATPTPDIETQRARAIEALDYPPERENALRWLREHPETPTPDIDPETERFARIGKLFCELWEAGAPWPVRHWTCDKHKVKGCLRCKATTAPEVRP